MDMIFETFACLGTSLYCWPGRSFFVVSAAMLWVCLEDSFGMLPHPSNALRSEVE